MSDKMKKYHDAMYESLMDKTGLFDIAKDTSIYYYPNEYAASIKEYYESHHLESKELGFKNGSPYLPICSLCSSARLCYLYFRYNYQEGTFLFEQKYPILKDNGSIKTYAHPDAIVGETYYECKSQELIEGEKEKLVNSYLDDAKFFKEFFLEGRDIKKGEEYLTFNLQDMGIDIDKPYYEIQFNIKQMICHLLALSAHYDKCQRAQTLQYIIFTPQTFNGLNDIYYPLLEEINKIFLTDNCITRFAFNHHINLPLPLFIPINAVNDFIINK